MSRLKNSLFTLFALAALPFRNRYNAPERILVVQTAKLGDMVCTTPMFAAIKKQYPNAVLFVMGNALNRELLAGNPYIDQYLVDTGKVSKNAEMLRGKHIDFACQTSPNLETLATLIFARIPRIAVPKVTGGFSPYETRTYKFLRGFVYTAEHTMGTYAPREYLRLLEPIDIVSDDTTKELFVSSDALARVQSLLGENTKSVLVGIAPGVGNKLKVWGGAKFAAVAEGISKAHPEATIILIGGKGDASEIKHMHSALPSTVPTIDLSEKLSLEELKALISQLQLFISVDTGPVYIAEAFGTPTVDIVGPMDENEQPPRGAKHMVVVPTNRTTPAIHIMNASLVDIEEARRQADAITAPMALEAALSLLAARTP